MKGVEQPKKKLQEGADRIGNDWYNSGRNGPLCLLARARHEDVILVGARHYLSSISEALLPLQYSDPESRSTKNFTDIILHCIMHKPLKFKSYDPGLQRLPKSRKVSIPKTNSRGLVPQENPEQNEAVTERSEDYGMTGDDAVGVTMRIEDIINML